MTLTSVSSFISGDSEIDSLNYDIINNKSGRSSTIYSKESKSRFCLEDFPLKRIIGKGSFGKVT